MQAIRRNSRLEDLCEAIFVFAQSRMVTKDAVSDICDSRAAGLPSPRAVRRESAREGKDCDEPGACHWSELFSSVFTVTVKRSSLDPESARQELVNTGLQRCWRNTTSLVNTGRGFLGSHRADCRCRDLFPELERGRFSTELFPGRECVPSVEGKSRHTRR